MNDLGLFLQVPEYICSVGPTCPSKWSVRQKQADKRSTLPFSRGTGSQPRAGVVFLHARLQWERSASYLYPPGSKAAVPAPGKAPHLLSLLEMSLPAA